MRKEELNKNVFSKFESLYWNFVKHNYFIFPCKEKLLIGHIRQSTIFHRVEFNIIPLFGGDYFIVTNKKYNHNLN